MYAGSAKDKNHRRTYMLKFSLLSMPLVLGTFLIPAFTFASGENAERVFENAKSYTVKIRTTISMPFPNDSKGTGTGAGFVIDRSRGWIATNAHVAGNSPGA